MPLYDLVCIATRNRQTLTGHLLPLVQTAQNLVKANGGLVRRVDNLGSRNLPQRMYKKGEGWFSEGDYWSMRFDANPKVVKELSNRLNADKRVIRHTTLKVGATAEQVLRPRESKTIQFNRPLPSDTQP